MLKTYSTNLEKTTKYNKYNLNVTYNSKIKLRRYLKDYWQIYNSSRIIYNYGFNPNLYFKSRSNSINYNKNILESKKDFKKWFKSDNNFYKAATTPDKTRNGKSKNTYIKCYQLVKRSNSYLTDNIRINQPLTGRC